MDAIFHRKEKEEFLIGILYSVPDFKTWGFMAFVLLALIAFNELGRTKKWGGIDHYCMADNSSTGK